MAGSMAWNSPFLPLTFVQTQSGVPQHVSVPNSFYKALKVGYSPDGKYLAFTVANGPGVPVLRIYDVNSAGQGGVTCSDAVSVTTDGYVHSYPSFAFSRDSSQLYLAHNAVDNKLTTLNKIVKAEVFVVSTSTCALIKTIPVGDPQNLPKIDELIRLRSNAIQNTDEILVREGGYTSTQFGALEIIDIQAGQSQGSFPYSGLAKDIDILGDYQFGTKN